MTEAAKPPLFLIAFINRKLFLAAVLLQGVSGYVLCQFTDFAHQDALNPLLGSVYVFLFAIGAGVLLINRRMGRGTAIALSLVGLGFFVIAAWLDVSLQWSGLQGVKREVASRWLTPLFGLAGALWVLVLVNTGFGFGVGGRTHRILFFLGNASYAIYLWHLLGQQLLSYAIGRLGLAAGRDPASRGGGHRDRIVRLRRNRKAAITEAERLVRSAWAVAGTNVYPRTTIAVTATCL